MNLKNLDIQKAIVINTEEFSDTEFISRRIHDQLRGNEDYIETRILLNFDAEKNETTVLFFKDSKSIPPINIYTNNKNGKINIEVSVLDSEHEGNVLNSIYKQLTGMDDYVKNKIILNTSEDRKDVEENGNCVKILYCNNRKNKLDLIL